MEEELSRIPLEEERHDPEDLERYRMTKYPAKDLPYETQSICPICLLEHSEITVIPATVFEENGEVLMSKSCEKHGSFTDVYWSDADMFRRVMKYWYTSVGVDNPRNKSSEGCPNDCGFCEQHLAHTALGLIDVTNRCNMRCPICFANAAESGLIYEPTPEQVLEMLKTLRRNLPVPSPAVQFAGGEPTVSDNLPQYVKWAKQLGFNHIMVASNGIRMSKGADYLKSLMDAGMNTIYLQFDGVSEKPYLEARGRDLRAVKDKVLDNCREIRLDGVVLVPTIVKGTNDQELGDIVQYAIDNRDIVRCINFQPVSITGRIDYEERKRMRITIPDAIHAIEEQTGGKVKAGDWYPVASMMGVGRALGLMKGVPTVELHSHFACGMATFLFIDPDGTYYPITEVLDIEKLMEVLEDICELYADRKRFRGIRAKLKLAGFMRHIKKRSFMKDIISAFLNRGDYDSLASFMHRVVMLGMMHFMDGWNIDLERVQHCTINYATPEGTIIPFCTYNTIHRNRIESRYSEPNS
ncbi:MAG: 7,8-dihydro-6-hydroxymethylpterin dimethyltransferase [Candidatus Thorarchaeota archaeon]|nr:MAG: 7,8-dihydro-6-hydroxymethylpterin dimethyltransferase [Candidatus Thorarchaeota archaeon]